MKRVAFFVLTSAICATSAGCATSDSEEAGSTDEQLTTSQADRSCRVFLLNAGMPTHQSINADFNPVSAITSRQDAAGHTWWPFAADVGIGAGVRGGITVGVTYSIDGHTWRTVEAVQPASSLQGTRVFHLEWGEDLFPFASGSVLMCPPGTLSACLSSQPELRPMAVEAFVRMPDGTTYYDHNTANADTALAGDMSSLHLDSGNVWQAPARDLLHCLMPGT